MKIESNQVDTELVVLLEDVTDSMAVKDAIAECADGRCACSTEEYEKVQSLQITQIGSTIQLNIEVKPGEVIDPNCISDCLNPLTN